MPDNKPTDNEIIKALEECIELRFDDTEYATVRLDTLTNALDLIDRLQAQNKDLAETTHNLTLEKDALFDKAEELKSEVEMLEKTEIEIDDFCRRLCRMGMLNGNAIASYEDLQNYIQEEKSEAVREFAERLKNEIISDTAYGCDSNQHSGYYDYTIKIGDIPEYIDNLVKEMVGDKE